MARHKTRTPMSFRMIRNGRHRVSSREAAQLTRIYGPDWATAKGAA